MKSRILSDYCTFKKRIENYHGPNSVCDTLTYHYVYSQLHILRNKDPFSLKGIQLAVGSYLIHWGGMGRWLAWKIKKKNKEENIIVEKISPKIFRVVKKHQQVLDRLRSANFEDVDSVDMGLLQKLFDTVCGIEFGPRSKRKRFGPTATGKLLHILLPNICVIWDKSVVRDRWKLKDDGQAYVNYLREKWKERDLIVSDFSKHEKVSTSEITIERHHAGYLRSIGFDGVCEPMSKLLDEANYPLIGI